MTGESWKQKVVEPTAPVTSGWTLPTPGELAPLFPDLEIVELLGRGGMGAVYKVKQRRLDRWAALKVLPAEVARDPAFAERFAREARVLAGFSHPNIVTVYDFGSSGGRYWFLMEFVDGLNLRQLIAAGKVAPREALAVVPQICDALQFAHEQGVVHRDIKPENILLDKAGRVKVTDFGLAKLMERGAADVTLTCTGQTLGSPPYMAPEQIERPQEVDHRADIYSLGVVFYQMLTGELPLGRFAPPSRKVHIDVRLDEIVLRTLEKEPELRYQHAIEVKTRVETVASTPPPSTGRGDLPARPPVTAPSLSRHAVLFFIYTMIGYSGLALSTAYWPGNFFIVGRLLHWILPAVVLLSVGLLIAGGVIYSLGKGYGWGPGMFALLGPLGVAILIALPHKAADGPSTVPRNRQPNLCPTAIWGAVQAAIFLVVIPGCFLFRGDLRTTAILALIAVGVSTTICGAIAISQIRHSGGRLHGLRLAVFELLLFPLLLLNAAPLLLILVLVG